MPELPEVETIRRALALRLTGRTIVSLTQRRADLRFPLPARLDDRLIGRTITAVGRRAKYMFVNLDTDETVLLHLGMSGRLLFDGPEAGVHEHLTFGFDDGTTLRFVDPRRFGMLDLVAHDGLADHPRLARLGLEPLASGFDGAALATALQNRRLAIKVALMDQKVVVGVGNIYASESLHRARLSPRRTAGLLRPREAMRLADGVRTVLADAIDAGGSSLRDYVQADGEAGFFQDKFAVYGRAGEPCPRCRHPVRHLVQAGRATYFCSRCQR